MHITSRVSYNRGFTLVEILVVIAVIGILASVSVVGYGAWRKTASIAQVKSDLNAVASAMESARTFTNKYPLTVPSTVTPSEGVSLLGGGIGDQTDYCVDGGTIPVNVAIRYYVDADNSEKGAQAGTCATRPVQTGPGVPTNLAIISAVGSQVTLSWNGVSGATSYTAQCASDAAYIVEAKSVVVTATSGTVIGLTASSSYFCRVNAVNTIRTSAWSASISTETSDAYGSLAVGSSIDGYWTAPPKGFLIENGATVSRTEYAALYAVIKTTFGAGDGSTTFNLPDSRGRASVTISTTDAEFNVLGEKPGSKTEILTLAQIASHNHLQGPHTHSVTDPGHNHSQNAHSHGQVVTANQGAGSAIRRDYDSDGAAAPYPQGINTGDRTATNNPSVTGVSMYGATATNQNTGGNGGHNNIQPSIVKLSVIKYTPADTVTAATLPIASSINGYWNTAPAGYLLENGAAVSRVTYVKLFQSIGTTYGAGNGVDTFNVPNSAGRVGVNISTTDSEFNVMGEMPGSKTESLTVAQMPVHAHTQNSHIHGIYDTGHNHSQNGHNHVQQVSANAGSSVRSDWNSDGSFGSYDQGTQTYGTQATNNPSTTGVFFINQTAINQSAGGGTTHNNIQPSFVKKSAIKTTPEITTGTPVEPGTSSAGYWTAVPAGYLAENGASVLRADYPNLFLAIGTMYGTGSGANTFNVPNSTGRVGVNKSDDAEFNVMGEKYGEKSHILTIAQIASHTHLQNSHTHPLYDTGHNHSQNPHVHDQVVTNPLAGWPAIRSDYQSDVRGTAYTQNAVTADSTATNNVAGTSMTFNGSTAVTLDNGSGAAHNVIQPSIVKRFVIKI